jgi:hypothetical protein
MDVRRLGGNMADKMNYFEVLNSINVSDKTEKKGNLTYLSWAWAWGELKKRYPNATYKIYENEMGWNYHTDGKTAWVKTGVTVEGIENIEYLPVMDFKNNSIPVEKVTSTDVNKTIQRSLTKAVARHGLGLYIYAGEDLPEAEREEEEAKIKQKAMEKLNKTELSAVRKAIANNGYNEPKICEFFKIEKLEDMTVGQLRQFNEMIEKSKEKK